MATVKVMTYNLRVDNAGDGINSFTNRHARVIAMLEEQRPDLIGFQECTHHMRAYLEQHMQDYVFVGCGREKDCTGESMAIAYRKDAFALVSVDNFWLTATPHVPGSTLGGDQSACPRMATIAVLRSFSAQQEICVCNTHLDHVGKVARQIEAALLCAALDAYKQPVILMGDMNAHPDTPEIVTLTAAMEARGDSRGTKVTHKIYEVVGPAYVKNQYGEYLLDENGQPVVAKDDFGNPIIMYTTYGINNKNGSSDTGYTLDGQLGVGNLGSSNVFGKPVFSIPFLGYVASFVQNPPGKYVAIAICAFLILTTLFDGTPTKKTDEQQAPTKEETPTESDNAN